RARGPAPGLRNPCFNAYYSQDPGGGDSDEPRRSGHLGAFPPRPGPRPTLGRPTCLSPAAARRIDRRLEPVPDRLAKDRGGTRTSLRTLERGTVSGSGRPSGVAPIEP